MRLTNGFTWNTTLNYLRNRSRVDSLYPRLATIIIASQWSSNIEARQGQPYGVLFGYAYLRDSATGKRMPRAVFAPRSDQTDSGECESWIGRAAGRMNSSTRVWR